MFSEFTVINDNLQQFEVYFHINVAVTFSNKFVINVESRINFIMSVVCVPAPYGSGASPHGLFIFIE